MLSLRQIRRRIKSVENTKKMTHAMEMVAASKLKKLQDLLKQSDRYISELKRILGTLVREKPLAHLLLEKRAEVKSVLAFLIASDTGLCGSYNTNIFDQATRFISPHLPPPKMGGGMEGGESIHFVAIGRQAGAFLRRRKQTITKELNIPRPQEIEQTVQEVTQIATNEFQASQADKVVFIYTKVFSLGSMKPDVGQLFPIVSEPTVQPTVPGTKNSTEDKLVDYIIEPSLPKILDVMLPEFIEAQVAQFIKNAMVAEQAARMMAMRQATDNAEEMIEDLTLARNKARQASITKELIEVVSGSRALQMK